MLLAAGCSSGGPSGGLRVRLNAGPASAPFDTPVHITVSGLPAAALVTLQAKALDSAGRPWESAAQFRADAAGTLDLATAVPVSGNYHVADAAGLLWSLHPAFASNPANQFYLPENGFNVRLRVLADGHVEAAATLVRQWTVTGSTQSVRRDGFAGTLFVPATARPLRPWSSSAARKAARTPSPPGRSRNSAIRPSRWAISRSPGSLKCLCDIPLEYFARAAGWLRKQPATRGRPVVLDGGSRGAEGALLIASYQPHLLDAVVANSPAATSRPDSEFPSSGRAAVMVPPRPVRSTAAGAVSGAPPDIPRLLIIVTSRMRRKLRPGQPTGGGQQANAVASEQFRTQMIKFLGNSRRPVA